MGIGIGIFILLLALAAAAFIGGVVVVGTAGKGWAGHPRAEHLLGRASEALNGQGEPPARLTKLLG